MSGIKACNLEVLLALPTGIRTPGADTTYGVDHSILASDTTSGSASLSRYLGIYLSSPSDRRRRGELPTSPLHNRCRHHYRGSCCNNNHVQEPRPDRICHAYTFQKNMLVVVTRKAFGASISSLPHRPQHSWPTILWHIKMPLMLSTSASVRGQKEGSLDLPLLQFTY